MEIFILALLGLAFGSFITALTWRLHKGKDFVADRSQCESCGHKLAPQDLIPVLSWVMLKGRCRYCRKKISWQNPAIELGTMVAFIVSFIFWPHGLVSGLEWATFALWLVFVVMLGALLVYDLRWMLLPDKLVFPLIALGLLYAALLQLQQPEASILAYLQHVVLGAGALGGVYWLLYTVSKGRWVGFGDVKLGIFMGIALGWQPALLVLFLANIIGCLVVGPGLLVGRLTPKSRVPFGPFLIIAFFIAGLFGQQLITWYVSLIMLA